MPDQNLPKTRIAFVVRWLAACRLLEAHADDPAVREYLDQNAAAIRMAVEEERADPLHLGRDVDRSGSRSSLRVWADRWRSEGG